MFPLSAAKRFEFICSRDTMVNKLDCVELGLACADVCRALDCRMGGRRLDQLSRSVCEAIEQIMTVCVRPTVLILCD